MVNKTWKRETGILFTALLCYQIYLNNIAMVEVIIWPFITFIAAAAGLHIYDKNFTGPNAASKLQHRGESGPIFPDK